MIRSKYDFDILLEAHKSGIQFSDDTIRMLEDDYPPAPRPYLYVPEYPRDMLVVGPQADINIELLFAPGLTEKQSQELMRKMERERRRRLQSKWDEEERAAKQAELDKMHQQHVRDNEELTTLQERLRTINGKLASKVNSGQKKYFTMHLKNISDEARLVESDDVFNSLLKRGIAQPPLSTPRAAPILLTDGDGGTQQVTGDQREDEEEEEGEKETTTPQRQSAVAASLSRYTSSNKQKLYSALYYSTLYEEAESVSLSKCSCCENCEHREKNDSQSPSRVLSPANVFLRVMFTPSPGKSGAIPMRSGTPRSKLPPLIEGHDAVGNVAERLLNFNEEERDPRALDKRNVGDSDDDNEVSSTKYQQPSPMVKGSPSRGLAIIVGGKRKKGKGPLVVRM